jgi:hypothetical protein
MKFKKTTTAMFLALAMVANIAVYAAPVSNEVIPATTPAENAANEAEMARLTKRLEEIRAMDIENMPRSEKRKYAKEVKQLKKKMNAVGGGVYISAGALLVIVVLLILLL